MNLGSSVSSMAAKRNATAAIAMVTSSRHRVTGALVLATGLSVGGCQNPVSVGAFNRCGVDLEIQADTVSESSTSWIRLGSGDRDDVVQVGENAERLYVRVRVPGAEEARSFETRMASLGRLPADVGYEAQLVLVGDRCP
jgi:hypothetical protein